MYLMLIICTDERYLSTFCSLFYQGVKSHIKYYMYGYMFKITLIWVTLQESATGHFAARRLKVFALFREDIQSGAVRHTRCARPS